MYIYMLTYMHTHISIYLYTYTYRIPNTSTCTCMYVCRYILLYYITVYSIFDYTIYIHMCIHKPPLCVYVCLSICLSAYNKPHRCQRPHATGECKHQSVAVRAAQSNRRSGQAPDQADASCPDPVSGIQAYHSATGRLGWFWLHSDGGLLVNPGFQR